MAASAVRRIEPPTASADRDDRTLAECPSQRDHDGVATALGLFGQPGSTGEFPPTEDPSVGIARMSRTASSAPDNRDRTSSRVDAEGGAASIPMHESP